MAYTRYSPNSYPGGGLEVVPNNLNQPAPEVYHPPTETAQARPHTQASTSSHQQNYGQEHAPVDRIGQEPVHSSAYSPTKESYRQSSYGPASPPQDHTTAVVAMAPPSPPTYKKVCGVRPVTFIFALLLVLVIIIAAVAGGVGGTFAVRDAYDRGIRDGAEATVTVTATAPDLVATTVSGPEVTDAPDDSEYPIATPSAIPRQGFLALDCPDLNDQTHTVAAGETTFRFRTSCGTDHTENGNDNVDISAIPAWSIQDCMLACAAYSRTNLGSPCVAVTFNADLDWVNTKGGNCWLKSKIDGDAGQVDGNRGNTFGEAIVLS